MAGKRHYITGERLKKLFTRLAIIIAVLLIILIIVLKIIESSQEQIKQGLENYLSQSIGYPAKIGEMERVTFFPVMVFDASDIYFWSIEHPDHHVITLDRFRLSLPFWSVILRTGKVNDFALEGLTLTEFVTGGVPLLVEQVNIDPASSAVVAALSTGDVTFEAAMPVDASADQGPPYQINSDRSVMKGTVTGMHTQGSVDLAVTRESVTGMFDFSTLDLAEIAPLLAMVDEKLSLTPKQSGIALQVERFAGGGGPYHFKPLSIDDNGAIQPFSCLSEHGTTTKIDAGHPCGAYLKEE